MKDSPQYFTASQFARALGKKQPAVHKILADVPTSGTLIVRGVAARAWQISALPAAIQNELSSRAQSGG
ncbi:MAG TPA: hypothetical protein VHC44_06880, partial [Verrucomicrobiae bacterium]|nr:hypothetical protein [Verrucomicrobiae bacterium]